MSARLNAQSEDYSMILTTTIESTDTSVLEENGIGNEQGYNEEPEPHGGLAALQEKDLKVTSYSETDGAARPITRKRCDDEYY